VPAADQIGFGYPQDEPYWIKAATQAMPVKQ
jgi:hypothetical protein